MLISVVRLLKSEKVNVIICYTRMKMKENKEIKLLSILGIIGNITLLLIKAIVGMMFKSMAMIADAANSAGDIFASIMVFIGNKISAEPADDDHNMGHGKAEYIFSAIIGLSMIIASLYLIVESIKNSLLNIHLVFSWYLVIFCILTILIKFSLYLFTKKVSKNNNSILVISLLKDHRNDCFISAGTLISIFFSFYNIYYIDVIVSVLISGWIILTGFTILVESYNVLMDQSIDEENKKQIIKLVQEYSPKIEMGKLSSVPIGYKYIILLTIYVDGNMPTIEAHNITKDLQSLIKEHIKLVDRVIIHVNPKKK